ncbi:unnamed protein product [Musa acuminata subsp. malaccensis]|uniref:(wild Malaysian banana) hypothetical protein n=1 Tax=Musa acuminata subsp. malaccensis TaxID=214687 RepID=A0A804J763_MUSAM|nr:unnamed protein product [Musa acuminata subsp. malaccensis]
MQRVPHIKAGGDNSVTPFFVFAVHTTDTAAFGYCEMQFCIHLLKRPHLCRCICGRRGIYGTLKKQKISG